jgi:hypothetical protein
VGGYLYIALRQYETSILCAKRVGGGGSETTNVETVLLATDRALVVDDEKW